MTQIQKKKRIVKLLDRNKVYFKMADELANHFEEDAGYPFTKEDIAGFEKSLKSDRLYSEAEFSQLMSKLRKKYEP